ncbi:MAG: hypothetical protein V8Q42_09370 [Anaerovoracaceae bacterium]
MAKAGLFEGLDAAVMNPADTNTSGYRDCPAFNVKRSLYRKRQPTATLRGQGCCRRRHADGHAIEIMREHVEPGSKESPNTINYAFPDCGNAYPVVVPDRSTIWVVGRFANAALLKEVRQDKESSRGLRHGDGHNCGRGVHGSHPHMIANKVISDDIYENFSMGLRLIPSRIRQMQRRYSNPWAANLQATMDILNRSGSPASRSRTLRNTAGSHRWDFSMQR